MDVDQWQLSSVLKLTFLLWESLFKLAPFDMALGVFDRFSATWNDKIFQA